MGKSTSIFVSFFVMAFVMMVMALNVMALRNEVDKKQGIIMEKDIAYQEIEQKSQQYYEDSQYYREEWLTSEAEKYSAYDRLRQQAANEEAQLYLEEEE